MARNAQHTGHLSATTPMKRCAIYTRKSTEEGLDQDFTSLDNQREACEAFIRSQQHEGWVLVPQHYDDGGFSGGTMARPALQKLLREVEEGRVDIVVVHRIDRLTRSLLDFGKIVEVLDGAGASFVSVTQQFNTTSSMGRLTLNILLSFAQFERELTTERIREKVAAHKRLGKYTGGMPILGYDVDRTAKRLVVNPDEAELVRDIFQRFVKTKSALTVIRELNAAGKTTKAWVTKTGLIRTGHPWDKSPLYKLLNNKTYIGLVTHKGKEYQGEHEAILEQGLWDKAQAILKASPQGKTVTRHTSEAFLKGLIFCGHHDCAMGMTYTAKGARKYRYYQCTMADKRGWDSCPVKSVPAGEIEKAVLGQVQVMLRTPEVVAQMQKALSEELAKAVEGKDHVFVDLPTGERDLVQALADLDAIWDELFPVEKARIFQLLVGRVEVHPDRLDIQLRSQGIHGIVFEAQTGLDNERNSELKSVHPGKKSSQRKAG